MDVTLLFYGRLFDKMRIIIELRELTMDLSHIKAIVFDLERYIIR